MEDLGKDKQLHCRTHLGHILKVGDIALGFDLTSANINDPNIELMKEADIPSVVSTVNMCITDMSSFFFLFK